jgi:hypothetical protein
VIVESLLTSSWSACVSARSPRGFWYFFLHSYYYVTSSAWHLPTSASVPWQSTKTRKHKDTPDAGNVLPWPWPAVVNISQLMTQPWSLFTWPTISRRRICRDVDVCISLQMCSQTLIKWKETGATTWLALSLHCLFLFLATVTKERAIPGTQLSWFWQTLVYGYPLTRF